MPLQRWVMTANGTWKRRGSGSPPPSLAVTVTYSPATVSGGNTVTLPATVSGGVAPFTYLWTPPAGVTLSSTSAASPTFTAPNETTTLTFDVRVTDSTLQTADGSVSVPVSGSPQGESLTAGHTPYNVRVGMSAPDDGNPNWPPNTTEALQILSADLTAQGKPARTLLMHRRFNNSASLQWLKDMHAEQWARGEMPYCSFGWAGTTKWQSVIDGGEDALLTSVRDWAKTLRGTGKPLALTVAHEPDQDGDLTVWGRMQIRLSNFFSGWSTNLTTFEKVPGSYTAANDVSDILAWHSIPNGHWWGPNGSDPAKQAAGCPDLLVRTLRENRGVLMPDFYDPNPGNDPGPTSPTRDAGPFTYPVKADRTHMKMQDFVKWARNKGAGAIGCGEFSATEAAEITRCWEVVRNNRDIWVVASHFNSARNSRWPWRLIPDTYGLRNDGTWRPGEGPHPDNYKSGVLILRDFGGSATSEARLNAFRTMVDESKSSTYTSPL